MQPRNIEDRRKRQRSEARRAILDATETLLITDGIEHFSIRNLSAACGYAAPTIYHHFGDKEGLILAILEQHFDVLLRRVRRVKLSDDPLENLRGIATAFIRFGIRQPTLFRLLVSTARDGETRVVPSAEEVRLALQQPLEELAEAGRLRHGNVDAARQAVWALLNGLTALQVSQPDWPWSKDLNDIAIDALLRGLINPPASMRAAGKAS